jgi:hypothetical protein
MPDKNTIQLASRAIALYLVFWGFGNLVSVPALIFSALHYYALPGPGSNYLYKSEIISLTSHLVFAASLLLAATWCYRCTPRIQAFLSAPEEDIQEGETGIAS